MILGIDEVGRGPWAGPLVVGAVVLGGAAIDGLTDSKKLSKKRREELDVVIREQAAGFGLGWVSAEELDEVGLSQALVLATKRAVEQVRAPYSEIMIDGTINFLKDTTKGQFVTTLPKADLLIPSVSAASIIAKVARDNYMTEQDDVYPGYHFKSHVGYGTAAHRAAIKQLGVTPLHRLSFAPLAKYAESTGRGRQCHVRSQDSFAPLASDQVAGDTSNLKQAKRRHIFPHHSSWSSAELPVAHKQRVKQSSSSQEELRGKSGPLAGVSELLASPTTKQIGDAGETAAANYLVLLGHEIIERNWRTKFCEIDIVSKKGEVIYFTEVKYRKRAEQGGGLAAITAKKLRQMKFAAEYFALKNDLTHTDMRLCAMAVSGEPPVVETYLELE